MDEAPGHEHAAPPARVIPLRPIRTLVISGDLDYRDRALSVISKLGPTGFAVGSPTDPDDVLGLVDAERADVVVLDATGCEPAARHVIAALAQWAPRVGVVIVCHHCSASARELGALPKWGWTQDLRAAVERANREGNPLRPWLLTAVRRGLVPSAGG